MTRSALWEVADAVLAAGHDPAKWLEIPSRFADLWPGSKIALNIEDATARSPPGVIQSGFDPAITRDYLSHYALINPWRGVWHDHPSGVPLVADHVLPSDSFRRTEFYEWVEREGEVESAAGIKSQYDGKRFANLTVHYSRARAKTYNDRIAADLSCLASSFEAALALNHLLAQRAAAAVSMDGLLAAIAQPALVLDPRGGLVAANPAGESVLRGGTVLYQAPDRRLRPTLAQAQTPFATAIRQAARPPAEAGALASDVPLRDRATGRPVLATLAPLTLPGGIPWLFEPARRVLLLLRGSSRQPAAGRRRQLRLLFGLTAMEARLMAGLANGHDLASLAPMLGIARNTARQHLKSVFRKTGMHRQPELVLLASEFGGGGGGGIARTPAIDPNGGSLDATRT